VLATWRRHGVFGPAEGEAVATCWRGLERQQRFTLRKDSFVPDHVHLAVRTHPSVAPSRLVAELMSAGQRLLWERFADEVIRARGERLWCPSAYVGSYGDLATPQVQHYLRRWAAHAGEA
jgi:REP element-mobilizing transposase RayT